MAATATAIFGDGPFGYRNRAFMIGNVRLDGRQTPFRYAEYIFLLCYIKYIY